MKSVIVVFKNGELECVLAECLLDEFRDALRSRARSLNQRVLLDSEDFFYVADGLSWEFEREPVCYSLREL